MRNGIHPPLSQENVQLSPDFRNCLLKLLGSMPVVMDPANISPVLLSLLGSMAIVNQIIMTKDETTGNYIIRFNVMSQNFTDGAYPHYYQIMNNEVPAAIGIPSQWVEFGIPKGAKWKYYQNGKILVNSWVKSNGKSYYLGADQYMVTGRKKINGNRYYFKSKIEGGKETTGYMVTHWNKIQGKWYYFHSSGKMMTLNWAQDEAKKHWYYCGSDGVMVTSSIIDWKGKKYFVEEDGAMAVNKTIVDPDSGKTYEADDKGVLTEGTGKPNTPLYNNIANNISKITSIDSKFDSVCNKFKDTYLKYKQKYEAIGKAAGVPPELIAIIHYRENTTDFFAGTFNVYLHNGDPFGKPTVNVPTGKKFNNFLDAAVDAINDKKTYVQKYKLTYNSEDIVAMMAFAEVYNGLGYYNNGHISPYLYSGTNLYVSGKYTSDGVYDPKAVDKQVGIYILLNAIV